MVNPSSIALEDEAATQRFGKALASLLQEGDSVGLEGRLGAGKTALARQVVWSLGVPREEAVTSPTFALVQEYRGRMPVAHADLYRLQSLDEVWDLGLEERTRPPWVFLVEWGRKHANALKVDVWLTLEIVSDTGRDLSLEAASPRGEAIVAGLMSYSM